MRTDSWTLPVVLNADQWQSAMADHCHKTNPRIATRDEYCEMLEASA